MARKRHSDEDVLKLLREIELKLTAGDDVASACRSVGISDATYYKAERLLFLDADTRLKPDFLERATAELDANEIDLGIALTSSEGLSLCYRAGCAAFNVGIRLTSHFFPTAVGACLFSTRRLHEEIGGFDETLCLCEDCNYALKAFKSDSLDLAVLKSRFRFDPRRLEQDGFASTGLVYLRANLRRFFVGELRKQEIPYAFGHYVKG